jgi:thiamine-phosphate pyrophosphorylase
MSPSLDLSLYLVIGSDVTAGRRVDDVAREAVAGGVTAVQLREKHLPTRLFVEQARTLVALLRPLGIPLIVNDRLDVALAADADGVHVGQDDMMAADVRRLVGRRMVVGLSVTTLDEAKRVDADIVDYVGIGPVFATSTKLDAARPLGLEGTAAICRVLRVPAVAIGGIDADTAAAILAAGVQGIALVSAICSAVQPREAAAGLALGQKSPRPA